MTGAEISTDPRLVDLLDRWFVLREAGQEPVPSDLTTDPDLLPALEEAIELIQDADAALGGGPAAPSTPASGVAGRYEVSDNPAIGGMGEVYPARDLQMNNRVVAYKVMKAGRDESPWLVEQFYREAVITDELRQPGVVPIYAKLTDDSGRPAYVMEFVRGTNLYDAIKDLATGSKPGEATDPAFDLLRRFVDACRIVGVAHDRGYVHADLNLKNIMLVAEGQAVRVVDWGSALKVGTADALRHGHAVMPEYRDPALDSSAPPTPASDVFALGVGLGKLVNALAAWQQPLLEGRKRASPLRILRAIVARACAGSPPDRYPTASALADDLQRLLAHQHVGADTREPLIERVGRWVSRHRTGVAATTALALGAAIALGAFAYAHLQAVEARQSRKIALLSRLASIDALADLTEVERRNASTGLHTGIIESLHQVISQADASPVAPQVGVKNLTTLADILAQNESHRSFQQADVIDRKLEEELEILAPLMVEFPEYSHDFHWRIACTYLGLANLKTQLPLNTDPAQFIRSFQASLKGIRASETELASYEAGMRLLDKAAANLAQLPPGNSIRAEWHKYHMIRLANLILLRRFSESLRELDDYEATSGPDETKPLAGARPSLIMAAEMEQQYLPWSKSPHPDHAKAVRLADYLAGQPGVSNSAVFNAACILTRASQDTSAATVERQERADRAMNYLVRIADQGYFQKLRLFPLPPANTIHELHTDTYLDPLRNRPDFQKLIARFPEK